MEYVLYVGPKLNWFQRRALKSKDIRVKVIYLPEILKTLSQSAFKYFFPFITDFNDISVEYLYARVRSEIGEYISPDSRLIVWFDGEDLDYFDANGSFSNLLEFLKAECHIKPARLYYDDVECSINEEDSVQFCIGCVEPAAERRFESQMQAVEPAAERTFDYQMKAVADEVKGQLMKLIRGGYPVENILSWLSQNISLSRLRITKQYKIVLVDYDIEIKMGPLPKTVFIFYLLHPEGVRFSYLQDYKDEILEIYGKVCRSDNPDKMEESIGRLIDPFDNSICEKCAAVKKAFITLISDSIAENYYISGEQGGPKYIKLDRSLVEWECDLY